MPDALNLFPARIPWGAVDLPGGKGQAPSRGQVTLSNEAFKALALLQQRVGGANSNIALNAVLAGPSSGNPGLPTFRALTNADLPIAAVQAANLVYAGPLTGVPAVPTFRSLASSDVPGWLLRAFSAYRATALNIASAAYTIPICDTISLNQGSAYSATTGTFTAPDLGANFYTFKAGAQLNAFTAAAPNFLMSFFLNGAEYKTVLFLGNIALGAQPLIGGSCDAVMNQGDTMDFRIYQDSGAIQSINPQSSRCWFQGHRVA